MTHIHQIYLWSRVSDTEISEVATTSTLIWLSLNTSNTCSENMRAERLPARSKIIICDTPSPSDASPVPETRT